MTDLEKRSYKETLFFLIITINTIIINIDSAIYVPSFPSILKLLHTTPDRVQYILSANFLGLCVSSLFYGPFADSYGRRKTMIGGFSIFLLGVVMCSISTSIESIIIWRFVQGMGSAAPIIVGGAAIFDVYKENKAVQLIAIWNSIGTASMAIAPLIGGWLNRNYSWQGNFYFIAALSFLSYLSIVFFLRETLPTESRKSLNIVQIFKDYRDLILHKGFVANSLICALMYGAIMVYISNLSLIFIDFLHIPESTFSNYQTFTLSCYVVFSIICAKMIPMFGLEKTKTAGIYISSLGAILMVIVAKLAPTSPMLISSAMSVVIAGVAFSIGIFGAKSMEYFPDLKGMAAALGTSFRLFVTSMIIIGSGSFFTGSIVPIAMIVAALIAGCFALNLALKKS